MKFSIEQARNLIQQLSHRLNLPPVKVTNRLLPEERSELIELDNIAAYFSDAFARGEVIWFKRRRIMLGTILHELAHRVAALRFKQRFEVKNFSPDLFVYPKKLYWRYHYKKFRRAVRLVVKTYLEMQKNARM